MGQLSENMKNGLEALHDYNIDVHARELFLIGESECITPEEIAAEDPGVEFSMASRLIRNLRFLMNINRESILIHMKTSGGYWDEGMAIHNAIESCPAHVTILSYTHARSMSSIIFQAADNRVMMPDAYFMFHLGTLGVSGMQRGVESEVEFYHKTTARMVDIYTTSILASDSSEFKGRSAAQIRNRLHKEMEKKEDVFLTAEQAVSWGLADEVFDGDWHKLMSP